MQTPIPYLLLVDDDPDDRESFATEFIFQNPGITVTQMESGHGLLQYLNNCPPEQLPAVLVLDFNMPDLTGPQLLSTISANDQYDRIVKAVWSTSRRTRDMQDSLRFGAAHYFVKPSTLVELKIVIQQLSTIFKMAARLSADARGFQVE